MGKSSNRDLSMITGLATKIVDTFVISKIEPHIALSATVTALGGIVNWAFQTIPTEKDFYYFKDQVIQALDHLLKKVAATEYKGTKDARSSETDPSAPGRDGAPGGSNDDPGSTSGSSSGGESSDPTLARDMPGGGGSDNVH